MASVIMSFYVLHVYGAAGCPFVDKGHGHNRIDLDSQRLPQIALEMTIPNWVESTKVVNNLQSASVIWSPIK